MTNNDLIEQFKRCEEWRDADQWDALGMQYFQRGCVLNAGVCFQRADACRLETAIQNHAPLHVYADLGFGGNEIEMILVPVAAETEG